MIVVVSAVNREGEKNKWTFFSCFVIITPQAKVLVLLEELEHNPNEFFFFQAL